MKLMYTGDIDKLKKLKFEIDNHDWYVYFDAETKCKIIIKPLTKIILLEYMIQDVVSYSEKEYIKYKKIPEIIYDLIQAGLVKKEDN